MVNKHYNNKAFQYYQGHGALLEGANAVSNKITTFSRLISSEYTYLLNEPQPSVAFFGHRSRLSVVRSLQTEKESKIVFEGLACNEPS